MNFYIYPYSSKVSIENSNPYIRNLMESLSVQHSVENLHRPSGLGILDIYRYLGRTDAFILNWIENIPERRGWYFQIPLFLLLMAMLRITGKKLVYILHNKVSHSRKRFYLKTLVFRITLKRADNIITHSKEGVEYAVSEYRIRPSKIHFFPHPVDSQITFGESFLPLKSRKYDLFLWGTMTEYKGVDKFLQFLAETGMDRKYRVLIAGKFPDPGYYRKVLGIKARVQIENRYVPENELMEMMQNSRIILFTYLVESILSSGALMDSLYSHVHIIGPDSGSFRDCRELGLISTYSSISELGAVVENTLQKDLDQIMKMRKDFVYNNSWEKFADSVSDLITRN